VRLTKEAASTEETKWICAKVRRKGLGAVVTGSVLTDPALRGRNTPTVAEAVGRC
jgi:hypothetical protein